MAVAVPGVLGDAADSALLEKIKREETLDPLVTPTRLPAARRIIAIGDLHGDLAATRASLRLAGVIDSHDKWIGGDTVVVQVGDVLDRGDEESAVYDLLRRLASSAARKGGAVHMLLGNHEVMNVGWDFRYVSPAGFKDFAMRGAICRMAPYAFSSGRLREQCEMYEKVDGDCPQAAHLPEAVRPRACAFRPGGPVARKLGNHNTVLVIGENVFVHAGLHGRHVRYGLERINREVRDWMRGTDPDATKPACVTSKSVVWSRLFSRRSVDDANCAKLVKTLEDIPAKRMIVGHTVQDNGINCACSGAVWRLDVGMSRGVSGAAAEVLEIRGDTVTALRAGSAGTAKEDPEEARAGKGAHGGEHARKPAGKENEPTSPLARIFKPHPRPSEQPNIPRAPPQLPAPKPAAPPRPAVPALPLKPAAPRLALPAPHAVLPAPSPSPSSVSGSPQPLKAAPASQPAPAAPTAAAAPVAPVRPQTAPPAPPRLPPAAPSRPPAAPPRPSAPQPPPKPSPAPAATKPSGPAAPAAKPAAQAARPATAPPSASAPKPAASANPSPRPAAPKASAPDAPAATRAAAAAAEKPAAASKPAPAPGKTAAPGTVARPAAAAGAAAKKTPAGPSPPPKKPTRPASPQSVASPPRRSPA